MPFIVDADYVVSRVLPTLIGPTGRYAGVFQDEDIQERVDEAAALTQQRLSTRFAPTTFNSWSGPGAKPLNVPADPEAVPAVEAVEYEGPYMWPTVPANAGFLSFRLRVRPVIELLPGCHLRLPGTISPGLTLNREWFRLNAMSNEITLMPTYGTGTLFTTALMPYGVFNFISQRLPDALDLNYRAGMTADDWIRFPQVNRLVALRAGISLLPILSMRINPAGLTSISADGLSQSRGSGYVFKDLEDRLTAEADGIQNQILDAWDGTAALSVL